MKTKPRFVVPITLARVIVSLTGGVSGVIAADKPDNAKIERLTGLKGTFNEQENVFNLMTSLLAASSFAAVRFEAVERFEAFQF